MILDTPTPALSREQKLVLAMVFLFPIILSVVFFPTPAADLRENINWGKVFPLNTPSHPPLQAWLAGALAWLRFEDSWAYALFAMLLNFGGLFYIYRIAKDFIGEGAAVPALLTGCGIIFISPSVLASALNADQIQIVFWLGIIYHALLALEGDRWRDWLLAGAFSALAILTKYFAAVLLFSLAVSFLSFPRYRLALANPRLDVSVIVCVLIAAPHFFAAWDKPEPVIYFWKYVGGFSWASQLASFGQLLASLVIGAPLVWVGLLVLSQRGAVSIAQLPKRDSAKAIVFAAAIMMVALSVVILFLGATYHFRFSAPILPLMALALVALVRIKIESLPAFTRVLLLGWVSIYAGGVAFALAGENKALREPADAAAAHIHREWTSRYTCGPAYVIGWKRKAYSLATYMGPRVLGLDERTFHIASWVDRERLRKYGAVVVDFHRLSRPDEFSDISGRLTAPQEFKARLRRTISQKEFAYRYQFLAPEGC